jgi:hypothetical protein
MTAVAHETAHRPSRADARLGVGRLLEKPRQSSPWRRRPAVDGATGNVTTDPPLPSEPAGRRTTTVHGPSTAVRSHRSRPEPGASRHPLDEQASHPLGHRRALRRADRQTGPADCGRQWQRRARDRRGQRTRPAMIAEAEDSDYCQDSGRQHDNADHDQPPWSRPPRLIRTEADDVAHTSSVRLIGHLTGPAPPTPGQRVQYAAHGRQETDDECRHRGRNSRAHDAITGTVQGSRSLRCVTVGSQRSALGAAGEDIGAAG